jgi:hypothetical protein
MQALKCWIQLSIAVDATAESFGPRNDIHRYFVREGIVRRQCRLVTPGASDIASSVATTAKDQERKSSPFDEGDAFAVLSDIEIELAESVAT